MAKRKPKSIAKLVEEAAVLLQLKVRLKAADDNGYVSCCTCGVTRYYKEDGIQGGHFISRRYLKTKLLEENIHPQCAACNAKHIGGGMPVEYTLYMTDTYGREFVDYLISMKQETHKYYRNEINEIITDLKKDIKELEDRVVCL